MPETKVSVIVPTRDRPDKLRATLATLARQDMDARDYEVIIVDDGSMPAVATEHREDRTVRLLRLEGSGASVARNSGAGAASGKLLVFVDDDMQLAPSLLSSHWHSHVQWPGALLVGSIRLPHEAAATPFGRFRQCLEDQVVPVLDGPVEARNFCTAANMAIERSTFEQLGGFDPQLGTGEDQDLALRHTDRGGSIVFVPAARAIHLDDALDVSSYCRRAERYMEELLAFGARHPDWPDNIERERVNGPLRLGREPLSLSMTKLLKRVLMWKPVRACALGLVAAVERIAPDSKLLGRLYRALLGAHLLRGYRSGLRRAGA